MTAHFVKSSPDFSTLCLPSLTPFVAIRLRVIWHIESPEQLLEEKQLQHCINKTLSILPPAQKAAFLLRDIEPQSFEEICETLQVSTANVRVLVHRARLTLMQGIDHCQETGTSTG